MRYTAVHQNNGMSLRDYFAGQALGSCIETYNYDNKKMAEKAYQYADAMLAERETENNKDDLEEACNRLLSLDDRLMGICERVMQKFPTITKQEILFKYSVNELFEMLGEEHQENEKQ